MTRWIFLLLFAASLVHFNLAYFLISILIGWVLSGIAVSCIYHRQIAHKLWQPKNIAVEYLCYFLIIASGQGSPLSWAYVHRLHHKYTDQDRDPQSPITQSKWRTFFSYYKIEYPEMRLIRDLLQDNKIMYLHTHWNKLVCLYLLILALIHPMLPLYSGGVYVWCSLFVGILNTWAHKLTPSVSHAQTLPAPVLFWGESYHTAHHDSPFLLKHGAWDIGYWIIKILKNH